MSEKPNPGLELYEKLLRERSGVLPEPDSGGNILDILDILECWT